MKILNELHTEIKKITLGYGLGMYICMNIWAYFWYKS